MKTRLTLVVEIDHDIEYNPVDHFVWYFDDELPEPKHVVTEHWEDVG